MRPHLRIKRNNAIYLGKESDDELMARYIEEIARGKKLIQELAKIKSGIKVYCRIQPTIGEQALTLDANNRIILSSNNKVKTFIMDKVFSPVATQEQEVTQRH